MQPFFVSFISYLLTRYLHMVTDIFYTELESKVVKFCQADRLTHSGSDFTHLSAGCGNKNQKRNPLDLLFWHARQMKNRGFKGKCKLERREFVSVSRRNMHSQEGEQTERYEMGACKISQYLPWRGTHFREQQIEQRKKKPGRGMSVTCQTMSQTYTYHILFCEKYTEVFITCLYQCHDNLHHGVW